MKDFGSGFSSCKLLVFGFVKLQDIVWEQSMKYDLDDLMEAQDFTMGLTVFQKHGWY